MIVHLYAPNTRQGQFYKTVMGKLTLFRQHPLIICRDFNIIVDTILDSSNPIIRQSTALLSLLHSEDLYDPWRYLHDTEKDYTFYSHIQKSYSRIDMFLVDKHTLQTGQDAKIDTITWSDQAPILLKLFPPLPNQLRKMWRLNTSLISRPHLQKQVTSEIENYFLLNEDSVSYPTVCWNAHKACLRDFLIKLWVHEKKECNATMTKLLEQIWFLEMAHKAQPPPHS